MILKLEIVNGWLFLGDITKLEIEFFKKIGNYDSGYNLSNGRNADQIITTNNDRSIYAFIKLKIDNKNFYIATDGDAYLLGKMKEKIAGIDGDQIILRG